MFGTLYNVSTNNSSKNDNYQPIVEHNDGPDANGHRSKKVKQGGLSSKQFFIGLNLVFVLKNFCRVCRIVELSSSSDVIIQLLNFSCRE